MPARTELAVNWNEECPYLISATMMTKVLRVITLNFVLYCISSLPAHEDFITICIIDPENMSNPSTTHVEVIMLNLNGIRIATLRHIISENCRLDTYIDTIIMTLFIICTFPVPPRLYVWYRRI